MSGNDRNDELGLLIIVVLKAQNLPDLHKYSKCNPYCVVSVSKDNKGQTIVDTGGGQFPLWDDEVRLTLSRHDSTKLVVKVLSQEQSGEDDVLLGTGTAELGDPSKWPNHQFDDWVLLSIGDEQQGEVYLEMTFYPAEHIKSSKGSDLVRKPSSVPAMERLSRVPQSLRPASGVNQKSATTGSHLPRYQLPLPGEPDDVAREGLAPVPTTWPPPAHNVLGTPNLTYPPPTLGIATPAAAAGGHLNVLPTFGHAISASPAPSPGLTPVSASSLGSPFLHNLSTDSRPASIGPPSGAHSLSRPSLELPPSAVASQTSFAPDAPPPIPPRPDSSLAARTNSPVALLSRPSSSDGGLQAPSPRQRRPLPSPPSPAATSNNAVPIDRGKGKAKQDAVPEETYARRKEREEEEERLKMERSVLAAEQRAIEEQLEQERRDAQMAAALSERMALDERIARAKQEQNRKQDEQKDAEIVRLLMLEEEREAKEQEERIKEDERIAKELADRERKQASEPKKLVKQVIDSKSDSKAPQQQKPKPISKKEPAPSSKASAKTSDSAPVKSENGGQAPSARSGLFSGWGKKSKGQ